VTIPEDILRELNGEWTDRLLVTATHTPKAILANALIALRLAPEWQGVLAYDELDLATFAMLPPPWLRGKNSWQPLRWGDREDALATEWLHHQKICVPASETTRAVATIARDASFHPIKDYLRGLQWDGTERVGNFAAAYLGAEATTYHAAVAQCLLVAAVGRVMEPGCKADHVPILEGPQGALKSTAIERLFSPWFTDDIAELGTKDAAMQVRGVWCLEIAELSSMTRGEVERVKAFITRRVDRFRPSYGRHVISAPRQCIFVGSTNSDAYLKDDTGGRRFWPIQCGRINVPAIERHKDQLWAEAVSLYHNGARWWLTNGSDVAAAKEEQDARYASDPWLEDIENYVEDKDSISVSEVLARVIDKPRERWTQVDQNRVAACLKGLGFKRGQRRPDRRRRYYREASK